MITKQIDKNIENFQSIQIGCKLLSKSRAEKRIHITNMYSIEDYSYMTDGKTLLRVNNKGFFEPGFYCPIINQKSKIIFNFEEPNYGYYPDTINLFQVEEHEKWSIVDIACKLDTLSAYIADKTGGIFSNIYTNIAVNLGLGVMYYKKDMPLVLCDSNSIENCSAALVIMPVMNKHNQIA